MSNVPANSTDRQHPRPRSAILATAGLTLALLGLLQHQLQRGQQLFERLVADGEIIEDRVIAHIEHFRNS